MARPKRFIPAYSLHKPSGRAVAYVARKPIYLGVYGSPESRVKYSELIERLATDPLKDAPRPKGSAKTLGELLLNFCTRELPRYSKGQQFCIRAALKPCRELFGDTPVDDFGLLRLRMVREAMIQKGWSRSYINKEVHRIKRVFRWGVSWELVSPSTAEALRSVESLAEGGSDARETRPRTSISEEALALVRAKFRKAIYRDTFDLLLLSGARISTPPIDLLSPVAVAGSSYLSGARRDQRQSQAIYSSHRRWNGRRASRPPDPQRPVAGDRTATHIRTSRPLPGRSRALPSLRSPPFSSSILENADPESEARIRAGKKAKSFRWKFHQDPHDSTERLRESERK